MDIRLLHRAIKLSLTISTAVIDDGSKSTISTPLHPFMKFFSIMRALAKRDPNRMDADSPEQSSRKLGGTTSD